MRVFGFYLYLCPVIPNQPKSDNDNNARRTLIRMKRTIISLLLTILILPIHAKDIVWFDGTNPVTYSILTDRDLVVETALNMFSNDMLEVTEAYAIPEAPSKATIHIYQLDKATDKERQELAKMGFDISKITKGHDAFSIRCHKKNIIVVGLTAVAQLMVFLNCHA